jgi:hypothetical protein
VGLGCIVKVKGGVVVPEGVVTETFRAPGAPLRSRVAVIDVELVTDSPDTDTPVPSTPTVVPPPKKLVPVNVIVTKDP